MSAFSESEPKSLLSKFSSCELSDALIKLGVPNGGYIPDITMQSPSDSESLTTRICGKAYTVQMVMSGDKSAPTLSTHFADTIPADSVVVIDAPSQAKNAVWGGLMTARAQECSAQGVVISGRCRDLQEHHDAEFPVFARGRSTLGQSPFTRPSAVNVPLTIGVADAYAYPNDTFPPTTVNPGDWIVADVDGVVCVPEELVQKVIELATQGQEVDKKCFSDIQAGKTVQEAFKLHRGK